MNDHGLAICQILCQCRHFSIGYCCQNFVDLHNFNSQFQKFRILQKVLYLGVLTDWLFSTVSAIFVPTTAIVGNYYLVIAEGIPGPQLEPFNSIGYIVNIFTIYFCVSSALVQFLYRFYLICLNKKLGWFAFGLLLMIAVGLSGFIAYRVSLGMFAFLVAPHYHLWWSNLVDS